METAVLTAKYGSPVRIKGISPQINGAAYQILPTGYNIKGELLTFQHNGVDYVYMGEIDFDEWDRKRKDFRTGYCKRTASEDYKRYENQIENLLKPENWFEDFEFAIQGDLFKNERVEFVENLTNGYKKYFIFGNYEFKITSLDIDFKDINDYPEQNLDQNSPQYCKIIRSDKDVEFSYSNIEEGNFFTKNFKNKIDSIEISPSAKEVLYEGIVKICFRINRIFLDVLNIIAIESRSDILNFVKNIPFGQNVHQYIDDASPITTNYFTKTDKTIAHLLVDWGYKDLENTKELPLEVNMDQFYDGLYRPFNNYYIALVNFHQNLLHKGELSLFDAPTSSPSTWDITTLSEQDKKRFDYLSIILPSSAISLLSSTERLNLIKNYIGQKSISSEVESNILKIIHSFYLFPEDGEKFLDFLLEKKDGTRTNFEALFNLFDDHDIQQISPVVGFFAAGKKNRRNFIYGLYEIWKKSKYDFRYIPPNVTPTSEGTNPNAFFQTSEAEKYYQPDGDEKTFASFEFGTMDIPPQYPGDSPGIGTSQHVENNYYVDEKLNDEVVHITKVITNNFHSVNQDGDYIGDVVGDTESWPAQKEHMYLHIYQPVNMSGYRDYEDLKDVLPQDPVIPAFVYYYCEEYDRIKDINAAWSLGIDVSTEILLFFISGGTSVIRNLRYLKYTVEIGKGLRATVATHDAVLVLRGTEAGYEVFTITVAMCFHAMNYIATTSDSEAAEELAKVFFWLTMLGAGATLYARIKATKAANRIASNSTLYNAVPDEVKPLIDHLVGSETAAVSTIKANLQTKYPELYNKFIALSNVGGVDYQRIFMQEFSKANPSLLKKMNDFPAAVDNWKNLLSKSIKDRKDINVLIDQERVDTIVLYYTQATSTKMRSTLEGWTPDVRWKFFDKVKTSNANFISYKTETALLDAWKNFHTEVKTTVKFDNLIAERQVSFLTDHGNNFTKFKNNSELIDYWAKIDDNPLDNLVHSTHIKKVNFLEDVQHVYTFKKKYPTPHPYHPGLEETIGDHIKGSPVTVAHDNKDYIIGYTGFHGDYAITEPNPITLLEATLAGGKKYYPGPLPTVNKDVQTAIRAGTEVPGTGAKDCQVWMWGYVTKKQNGQESLYLDANNKPIRTWVKKSNSAQTTIFVGMNEDKTLIEIAYARHNLTIDDWLQVSANRPSNTWRGESSEGVTIDICIGPEVSIIPATVPNRTLHYGTVMPQK